MHAVFCFVKNDGALAFKNLISDFQGIEMEAGTDLAADAGAQIVEGGQAVHEHRRVLGTCHELGVDLIGEKVVDSFGPDLIGLAHRDPDVGVDDVGILDSLHRVGDEFQHRAGLRRQRLRA